MAFRWLPDPERYKHPRLTWSLMYAFGVVLGRMFKVDHDLPTRYVPPPGTVIISNHLRDADAPILGTILSRHEGVYRHGVLPFFAMREDLFQRGAIANLFYACPRPFIHLLRMIPLGWLFGNVRTLPMRRTREFTWHDTLRELVQTGMGARDPADVFNARGLRELHACLRHVPSRVDEINPWHMGATRVARWGLRRLKLEVLRQVAPGFRAVVERHLRAMVDRLEGGYCLYFSAEGHVSMDGHFGRIRAGVWRLGRMTSKPLRMLPMTLSYDPLGPGRSRVIVRKGRVLQDLPIDDTREFSRRVREALVAGRVVTPSHLLAQYFSMRTTPFAASELATWLDHTIVAAKDLGLTLDPLFAQVATPALVDKRLHWLKRKHIVTRKGDLWYNQWSGDTPPSWLHTDGSMRYLANALADFSPQLVKAMPPCG